MNYGEHQLVQRIKERFAFPEFATLANVATPRGTYADAIAVNLWRSRGYEIVGFEVKSVRSDWLRELKNPEKAEGAAQYCNTFWIVANPDVVKLDELPLGWGLMEPQGKGLVSRQKAKPLAHRRDLHVALMVSLIRRALEKGEMTEELNAAREAGRQAGMEEGLRRTAGLDLQEKLDDFTTLHREFEERSGIKITEWTGGKELAEAYHVSQQLDRIVRSLGFARETLKREAVDITGMLTRIKEARNGTAEEV